MFSDDVNKAIARAIHKHADWTFVRTVAFIAWSLILVYVLIELRLGITAFAAKWIPLITR